MAEREQSAFGMVPRFETFSNQNPVYADRKRTKHGIIFRNEGKTCGALCRRGESSSVYPLITINMRCSVIIPGFMSIMRKLREEFANIGFELYQNIYRDCYEEAIHQSKLQCANFA